MWTKYFSGALTNIIAVRFSPLDTSIAFVFDNYPLTVAVVNSAYGSLISAFSDFSSGSSSSYSIVLSNGLEFSTETDVHLAMQSYDLKW